MWYLKWFREKRKNGDGTSRSILLYFPIVPVTLNIAEKYQSVVRPSNVYLFQDEDEFDPSR